MNDLSTFPNFEEIPHKADAAIIAYGRSMAELFNNAALGLFHLLGPVGEGQDEIGDSIVLQASDFESMLVAFLTELLFLAENGIKTEICKIVIQKNLLRANIKKSYGFNFLNVIKAVTFNQMKIIKKNQVFQTTIVFDI